MCPIASPEPCDPTAFTVVVDRDFEAVVNGCSEPGPGRSRTWINTRIRNLYRRLYERGDCHTVEVYEGDQLAGGLYGVSLGKAFFGESMFHRSRDASKVALVHLVARLQAGRYRLLDTQFVTPHLRTFGAMEVSRPAYHKLLDAALVGEGNFAALALDRPISGGSLWRGLRALKARLLVRLDLDGRGRSTGAACFVGESRPDACETVGAAARRERLPAQVE